MMTTTTTTTTLQAAINEGQGLGRVAPELEEERAEFIYRCVRMLWVTHVAAHSAPP